MSLISIIVRTKDRPELLREALESLAAQTHRPLEVIVVNDGGEDVSELVYEFAEHFERLKYLVHERPKGRAAAANTGLSAVEGEFFGFLDDDDLLLPEHLATLLKEARGGVVPYSRVRFEFYDEKGNLLKAFSPWEGDFSRRRLLLGNFIPFHSLLFPRQVIKQVGPLDEAFELFEDWDFLLRASAGYPFKAVPKITAIYRFFPKKVGLSRRLHHSEAEKEAFLKVVEKHRQEYDPELWYEAFLILSGLRYELSLLQEEEHRLKGALFETQEELSRLKEEFARREEKFQDEIRRLQEELSRREEIIAAQEASLTKARKEAQELSARLEEVSAHLRLMEQTLGWQLLERGRRFMARLAPEGTRRHQALFIGKQLLKAVLLPEERLRLKKGLKKFLPYARAFGLRAALSRACGKLSAEKALPPAEESWGGVLSAILDPKHRVSPLPDLANVGVTVVIPVYNAFEKLKKCLASVLGHTDLDRVHLLVIDDASTDERVFPYLRGLSERYGFELRRHEENLGFVRTVNEAIAARRGHLVILNSDTEVPPGWLERLLEPILKAPDKIGSTTPFSNRATICSFPEFCKDNDLPEGLTLAELDAWFARLRGRVAPVRLPTGVGFCMALNDRALEMVGGFDEETFGRGYGEENDWCLRAEKAGFYHVLVPWLFVAHHHGASFGPERNRLAEEGVRRVERKHPGYLRRIHEFVAQDPIKEIRETLKFLVFFARAPRPRTLVLSHGLGGGSELFLNDLKTLFHEDAFAFLSFSADKFLLKWRELAFLIPGTPSYFKALLETLAPDLLFINHLAEAPDFFALAQNIREAKAKKIFFLHDYFPLCPVYPLVREDGVFCGLPREDAQCRRCLKGDLTARGVTARVPRVKSLDKWRALWRELLKEAVVVAPAKAPAQIFKRVFPEKEVVVIPHYVRPLEGYRPPSPDPETPLTVAVLGGLNLYKGAEVVYRLAERIRRKGLPLRLVLFGYTYREQSRKSPELVITGPYRREDLPRLCKAHQPQVALIPSLWPETFSYTLSEALSLGLPALVFDLGAQAERVRKSGAGLILPLGDEEALLETLLELHQDPSKLASLQEAACKWQEIDLDSWRRRWQEVLA